MSRTRFRLAVFDMDGVLTATPSSWEFVHRKIGVDNSRNLSLFKKGEITYMDFLRSDVELWIGKMGRVPANYIREILDQVPLRNGIPETISAMNEMGMKTAIISGGIYWLAEKIDRIGNFTRIYANKIKTNERDEIIPDGTVMVDPGRKDVILQSLQTQLDIGVDETVSVGDTLQDVAMFRHSGFSIAFNSNEKSMNGNATVSVEGNDLRVILQQIDGQ